MKPKGEMRLGRFSRRNLTVAFSRFIKKSRALTVVAAVSATTGLAIFLYNTLAAGPFTITPDSGDVAGGDEITITGNNFATMSEEWTDQSYVSKVDLVVQLDGIQNRRVNPLSAGTSMVGNVATVASTTGATDNGYFWQDLACSEYQSGTAEASGVANCQDFIPKHTTGNEPTIVDIGNGATAIHLNGNNGFQVSKYFNLASTVTSTSSGTNYTTYNTAQIEIYSRQNTAPTTAAYAVLYEYGTTNTTSPGVRFYRNGNATNTASLGNCYTSSGSNVRSQTYSCANNTSWVSFSSQYTRYSNSASYNYNYMNGALQGTRSNGGTGTFTPANANTWFVGARNMTTTNGTSNTGSNRFNGEIAAFRIYRRRLHAQEVLCNYYVDQARYNGYTITSAQESACATGATNITNTGISKTTTKSPAPTVTVGGEVCTVMSYSDTEIKCTTPAGQIGRADVIVTPDASTSLPTQTYFGGYEYRDSDFEYDIMNTGVAPYTYAVNPDTLRVGVTYSHASLITITYPRTASDGSTTVMTNSVTMANSTTRTAAGGQCGGVACTTTTVKITGNAANIDGATGLVAFLKSLEWSGNAGFLRGDIRITVLSEDVEFWIDGDGNYHFYELVNSGNSSLTWSQAYNLAAARTFKGLKGYLISMTTTEEAEIIKQYTENSGTNAIGYTSGIRFRKDNTANTSSSDDPQIRYPKVDSTIGYAGNPITEMPAMPTGTGTISSGGYACTGIATTAGCTQTVARVPTGTTCPTATAYDTEWYWANPADNGAGYFMGRAGGSNTNAECVNDSLNQSGLASYWQGEQPQGNEMIMTYQSATGSSFGWHDYSNNAGSWYYVEYSEGWFDSGTYDIGETTYWSSSIPLEITIHHVRANTGEQLAPDTKAPSMGLNTTTNQFQCSAANGGQTIDGYSWTSSSCTNGQFPYDPANTTQEITYTYSHNSVPNPVPFRMERTLANGNYVYIMHTADSGTAVDDFGSIRQVVITYPTALQFASSLPSGWTVDNSTPGRIVVAPPQEYGVSATQVQNYLYTITFTSSGLTDVTGSVTVEVADYSNVPATGDPGRTSSSGALPQPVTYHYYRLGHTADLIPGGETIGLVNQSFTLSAPPQYLPIGSNADTAEYEFYQSSPAIGTLITYRGTATEVFYYYQPVNGLTVSFSMNGESALEAIPDQSVPAGDNAVRPPVDPVVLGKRFIGWYQTNTCANEFDFGNTPISQDITIFACFETAPNMAVVFETAGPSGTPEVPPNPDQITNITFNNLISAPTPPILPGYAFSSWNTEPMIDSTTCSGSPWDFAVDRVNAPAGTSEITLYSCWESRSNVTINFNVATNALATVQVLPNPASRSVPYNGTTTPPASPISEGYAFINWYTAPMENATTCGGAAFDFTNTRLTAAVTTAYACWEKRNDLTITFSKGSKEGDPNIQGWPTNVNDMPYNSAAAAYQPEVTLEGWRLSHWCESTNPDCSRNDRFDWSARRTSNLSLIAMWREDILAIDEIVPNYGSTEGGYRVTVHGSGFLSYDASSYAQNGLMVLLDGENNAGTLASPSHNAGATTWNNLAPAAATAFGNFALTNVTVNANSLSFNGSSSRAKSGSTANLNGTIGGTSISTVTTEVAYKQNTAGSSYSQLYEYGPFGYANNSYLNTFGEVLNASNFSTTGLGSCYIGQRTSTSAFTGGAGTCANNTISTTHTSIQSKASGTPRRLIIDGNYSSPAVSVANSQVAFSATRSVVIGARSTDSGQSSFTDYSNVSINTFRMYNRTLTDTEIRCNYLVDVARFQGIFDGGLSSCGSQLQPIVPDAVTINGELCTNVIVSNESQLSCVVPASTISGDNSTAPYREGTVDAYIKIGAKEATLEDAFTYQAPLAIFSISPAAGPDTGGQTVTITGTDFRDLAVTRSGIPDVTIGNNACTNIVLSGDYHSLTCTVPASTAGVGATDVTVAIPNRNQSATITAGYYYYSDMIVTNVSPDAGGVDGGTELTITGGGFDNSDLTYTVVLDYGNNPSVCIVTSKTDTVITCTTTAHVSAGTVDVMVSNGVASVTSVGAFTYVQVAQSYINMCYDESEGEWVNGDSNYIFIDQGTSANCRLTFDAPYSGTLSLSDDYYDTIDPTLSGTFSSNDERFSSGTFTLAYTDSDITSPSTGQVLYYTYTAPPASILEQYYDDSDTSAGYVGNGYDLYWPMIEIDNDQHIGASDDNVVVFGLLAEKYWIYPASINAIYVVGSIGSGAISTHGAYFPGTITFSDDLTYSDNPNGTHGIFGAGGIRPNNVVDLSDLEGADSELTYEPRTSATGLNYIRLIGDSNPAITNAWYDIKVADSCLSVTGPASMSRGQTAEFTLTATCGDNWSGGVELSDPFGSSGEVGGIFADTSATSGNPSGTFNSGTKTFTFTAGASETYERTFNWTMRDDAVTPPTFPSYTVYITVDDGVGASYTPVLVNADTLKFACASGYSNCTTAYVGILFDIAISPNGMFIGRAHVTSDGGGALGNNGIATWSTSDPYVMSATPSSPGRKTLTATITESNSPNMPVDTAFQSTAANSFDDYIWVMANATGLSGGSEITSGKPGTYTLTMNGPFESTIVLSDVYRSTSISAGGAFSPSQCTFSKAGYDPITNTTSCTFTYTPAAFTQNMPVTIRADKIPTYNRTVASSTLDVLVYAPITVTEICRIGTGGDSGVSCDSSGSFSGGDQIVIYGNNFIPYIQDQPNITVTFDPAGAPAVCSAVTLVDNNHITCTTPPHAVGIVDVSVDNEAETAIGTSSFTFRPNLSTISPNHGFTTGGNTVTITGGGFVAGQTTATIGGNTCVNPTVTDSSTLTCTAPASTLAGDGMGSADVIILVNDIPSSTLTGGYTYELALAITDVAPKIGPPTGGTQITITGIGFVSGQTTVQVGGQQCTDINVQNTSRLTCTIPASNLSGNGEGVVPITVSDGVNPSHTLQNAYTYRELMYASVAAPNPVPTAGGTTFSVVGYNFIPPSSYTGSAPTTVTFISNSDSSRLACTDVRVTNNMLITCTTPQASVGTYSVEVNNGYETAILTGVLTYEPNPMIVTDINPSYGLTAGGNTITISGSGFGENHITNSAYTQLEYLNFTAGTTGQYVNTVVNPTTDLRVEADFQYNAVASSTASYLFGTRTSNTAGHFSFFKTTSNNFTDSWGTTTGTSVGTFNTNRNYVVKNNGNTFLNDASVVTRTGNSTASTRPLYIGQINAAGSVLSSSYFNGRLWAFKIYTAGTLVRDFVPACRNSDSVGGLYDLVNDTFYASASTTAFSCAGIPVIEAEVEIDGNVCANATITSDTEITCTAPASTLGGDGSGTVDAHVAIGSQDNTLVAAYTYFNAATSYTNECRSGPDEDWITQPYVPQGSTIECRIVLDNPYQGTISLTDDYYDTIDPGLSGIFNSGDGRFASKVFTLEYGNTLSEDDRILYYTYTSPDSQTLSDYYEAYTNPEDCEERCDNGFDLYWPLLSASTSGDLSNMSNSIVVGLLAEEYYIVPNGEYGSYCVDCSVEFIVSTRGAPYFGTIELDDDLSASDNPSGASGTFNSSALDLSELDGSDTSFEYTPKTSATDSNYLRVYGTSSSPAIADSYFDLSPVYQSTLTITGPSMLKRGQTGTFTLDIVDAGSWSGTVILSDIFSVGGAADGEFVDLTGDGSFNSATSTYTFSSGGSYTRTFSYTVRDDRTTGTVFPGYTIRLTGDNGTSTGYTAVSVLADDLSIRCGTNYPNCTTAYVGEAQDISISPNGVLIGTGQATDHSGGQMTRGGAVSWSGPDPFVTSYSPASPGHKTITTSVSSTTNVDMDEQSYHSTNTNSLDGYIYVMANRIAISGPTLLLGGATATYTLTMNGPFVGTLNLSDIYSNGSLPANGVFSDTSCTFSLQDYVYTDNNISLGTGTTTCTFEYTPDTVSSSQTVRINAAVSGSYPHEMILTPVNITVRTSMAVSSLSPTTSSSTGGETITFNGDNLDTVRGVTIAGQTCSNLTIISATEISCTIPAYNSTGIVDIILAGSDGEIVTLEDSFEYYAPLTITSLSPTSGPTRGDTLVSIIGIGFIALGGDASDVSVQFDDAECIINDPETDVTATSITCMTTGHDAETVDITISNGVDATYLVAGFTYIESMTLDTICQVGTGPTAMDDPACRPYGSIEGDTDVVLTGDYFIAPGDDGSATTVTLDYGEDGAVECEISNITNSTIHCTTGAHDPGLVNVHVDNGFDFADLAAEPGDTPADLPISGYLYTNIYINLGDSDISYEIDLSSSSESSGYAVEQVGTNNPNGYDLYLQAHGSDLICDIDDTKIIPSITSDGQLTGSPNGSWGYNVVTPTGSWTNDIPDAPASWKRIPVTNSEALYSSSSPALPSFEDKIGLFFATKATFAQPACAYEQSLVLTAIVKP